MPKDTVAEPMEAAQLPADPTHDQTPEISPVGDVEMPEGEGNQFADATPDMIIEEELDYEDVGEEMVDELDEQEANEQELDAEDYNTMQTDGQKMPIS